jgi:predicted MFS family arabinose efflux permease
MEVTALAPEKWVDYVLTQRSKMKENKKNEDSIWVMRFLFLSYWGALGSIDPFLPMYYHSLGLSGQLIGVLGAITPFSTFLVAPLWGYCIDKLKRPFTVFYITFLVSIGAQLMVSYHNAPVYLMTMVFITAIFRAPIKPMIDTLVLKQLPDRSLYGRIRLFGQIGFGVATGAVGCMSTGDRLIIYPESNTVITIGMRASIFWQSLRGNKLPFFLHGLLAIPAFICLRAFHKLHQKKVQTKDPSKNISSSSSSKDESIMDGLLQLTRNKDALLFFFLVFLLGLSGAATANFAFIRMREVGASDKLLGACRLLSSIAGAPMFWFSGKIQKLLGVDRILILTLLCYATRFSIYAFMSNPLYGLVADAIRGISFAVFWSTATIYANRIAPPSLGVTMVRKLFEKINCQLYTLLETREGMPFLTIMVSSKANSPECNLFWLG